MINLFITYRCNLSCSYCFAKGLQPEYPEDLTPEGFDTLLAWMTRAALPAVAFIGGEPTLHPRLAEMIARTTDAGVSAVLFTNGLFPEGLADAFAPRVANFVINYNDPSMYTPAQQAKLHANLARLRDLGAKMTFSKNFSKQYAAYDYLIEGLDRYGVASVRYDISRPCAGMENDHFTLEETQQIMSHIVGFVKTCEARGVRTGLDCSVRLCDLNDEDRRYLERVSMKFTGICHPSIDVHPDLSASYCLPLRDACVADVTAFADREALMWHFARAVRPLRLASVSAACLDCKDFMRRCQGGCMALKANSRPIAPGCTAGCIASEERGA
ncbi:MAG: radical SAM protein [Solidesulfovibrio sp.]